MSFTKPGRRLKKTVVWFVIILLIFAATMFIRFYRHYFSSNIEENLVHDEYIYIPTGSKYKDVLKVLNDKDVLVNKNTFDWLSLQMDYPNNVHPGKYKITPGMSNYELIKMLRSGRQVPVKLLVRKFRLNIQFRNYVAKALECDSIQLQYAFDSILKARQIDTAIYFKDMNAYVLQNTYEFYWNTSAVHFWDKLLKEYTKFWNGNRLAKAAAVGLNPYEVVTLASIVEEETAMDEEKPTIASVYLNRLHKKMPLGADPTIKYALQDFAIRRVLFTHLEVESPYNTYKNLGLPPGPICIPSLKSIDAVLNAISSEYLYFCAKEDFSGFHNFAITYDEHLTNAKNYQTAYINRFVKHLPAPSDS